MQAAIRARLARCRLIPGAPMLLRLALVLLPDARRRRALAHRPGHRGGGGGSLARRHGAGAFPATLRQHRLRRRPSERARAVIVVATAPATTGLGRVDALLHGADYLDS